MKALADHSAIFFTLIMFHSACGAELNDFRPYVSSKIESGRLYQVIVATGSDASLKNVQRIESSDAFFKRYALPLQLANKPLAPGVSWTGSIKTTLLKQNLEVPVKLTVMSIGESVSVSGGMFKNCIKVTGQGRRVEKLGMLGLATIDVQSDYWFAPGIGLVKANERQFSTNPLFAGGERTLELTRAASK